MTLLSFLLGCDSPLTLSDIAANTGRSETDLEPELSKLLSENKLRKRPFLTPGGLISVYWTPSLIPFIEENPIITNPFGSPFDHQQTLDRLSDSQLQQERTWLQTKFRSVNQEFERLQHSSKIKLDSRSEAELEEKTGKWKAANQEMLRDMLAMTKKVNSGMTMVRLLEDLRIPADLVGWNEEDEDFDA
jgi:hypothetical protein